MSTRHTFEIHPYRDYTKDVLPMTDRMDWTCDFDVSNTTQEVVTGRSNFEISYYHIDYIYIHFSEMIRREIKNDKSVLKNTKFQQFMERVVEFNKTVTASRNKYIADPASNGIVPSPDGIDRSYVCTAQHLYSDTMRLSVSNWGGEKLQFLGGNTAPFAVNATDTRVARLDTVYYNRCNVLSLHNCLILIEHVQKAFDAYLDSKGQRYSSDFTNIYRDFHTRFNEIMIKTNNLIKNGDYPSACDLVENIMTDSVEYLRDLGSVANVEKSLIDSTADINTYFENLTFNDDDIMNSVRKGDDAIDLVDMDDDIKNKIKSLDKYSKMATIDTVNQAFGKLTNNSNLSISTLISQLMKIMAKNKNVPEQESINKLMKTLIYEYNGAKKAEYLSDTELQKIIKEIKDKNEQYLNSITNTNNNVNIFDTSTKTTIVANAAPQTATSNETRLNSYIQNYDTSIFGGKSSNKYYTFVNASNNKNHTVQYGGNTDDFSKFMSERESSSIDFKKIKSRHDIINNAMNDNKDMYNENLKTQESVEIIERNEYLIQMMNATFMRKFLLNSNTTDTQQFFNNIEKETVNFKKNLSEMWSFLKSSIVRVIMKK